MSDTTIFQNDPGQPKMESQPVQPPAQPQSPPPPPPATISPPPSSILPPAPLEEDHHNFFSRGIIIKIIIGLIVLLVIAFVIFQVVASTVLKPKPEKVTLTYWGLWDSPAVVKQAVADFQKDNPLITIEYSKQDVKEYRDRLMTRIQNGSGPDIYMLHNTWVPQLSQVLLPLPSDIISAKDFNAWFYPVVNRDFSKNGAIYGIPTGIDTLALFINQEIFDSARDITVPTNWNDFLKTARALTVKDENGNIKTAGAAMGTFDNVSHAPDIISLLLAQQGVDTAAIAKAPKKASEALDYYTFFAKGEGSVWDDTLDPSILAFAKGNLAMYFGYSWDIFTLQALNPSLSFKVYDVPHLPDRNMTIASYWGNGVSAKSKHPKEAFLFMKYLAKTETEQKLFTEESKVRAFGQPYARVELASLLKSNALVYPFVSQAQQAVSSYFVSDTYDNGMNAQLNGYLGNAVRATLNNTSADSAIQTLSQGQLQVFQKYGLQ